jgi:hypothetical protein
VSPKGVVAGGRYDTTGMSLLDGNASRAASAAG